MNENSIKLKSINEILTDKDSFFIPSYQRGYRWTQQQVVDLLNDIWEFTLKEKTKDEFYCLQPIVVKERNNQWEVIDGQQRLTTIYIILTYINNNIFKSSNDLFTIEFETRESSQEFLRNIDTDKKDENIDYFHICAALKNVEDWFTKQGNAALVATKFYPVLLDNTKVIWYQVNDDSDTRDIFTRINIGKIPLTNSELIKALFLRSDNFINKDYDENDKERIRLKQYEIAGEWDRIEYSLQDDEFWYFLNNQPNEFPTRIDFVFNLMAEEKNNKHELNIPKGKNEFFSFMVFNKCYEREKEKNKNVIDDTWREIKEFFMTFEEWYKNRELYHKIGFLLTFSENIKEIKKASENKSKKEFLFYLKERTKEYVDYQIHELDYLEKNPNNAIEKVLLLFNIQSLLNNKRENSRFPFNRYKKEKWSIEHIHAQGSEGLNSSESRRSWLIEIKDSLSHLNEIRIPQKENSDISDTIVNIDELISHDIIEKEEFEIIQLEIFKIFGNPYLHTIDNLALLSSENNSSLSNSIFPVKRSKIIELERVGAFIPICTRNVFLKYYSLNATHLYYWGENDREDYFNSIKLTIQEYLPTQIVKEFENGNN